MVEMNKFATFLYSQIYNLSQVRKQSHFVFNGESLYYDLLYNQQPFKSPGCVGAQEIID